MPARDALELSQSALAGNDTIDIATLRERIRERYPEAAPLPDHPELNRLLDEAGYDWIWDPATVQYRARRPSTGISSEYVPRSATQFIRRTHDVPPSERDDFATARDTDTSSRSRLPSGVPSSSLPVLRLPRRHR
jgi:hypothetical protein